MSDITDEVFGEIYAACKRKVSKDIQAELRSLRAKAKKCDKLQAENMKLRKQAADVVSAAKKETDAERKRLSKDRESVRRAAGKVVREANAISALKSKKLSAFVSDPSIYWRTAQNATTAMRAVRKMVGTSR